jgi:hypothetical protein
MGCWTAVIVASQGRADFWKAAQAEGVEPNTSAVTPLVLVDVDAGSDFEAPIRLAQTLSTVLRTAAIGFSAQTASDSYEIRAFDHGDCMRHLAYSRDDDGWLAAEGVVQPWEPAFFFDGPAADAKGTWPDTLDEELSAADVARYEAARLARDASKVMDLLSPRSTTPLRRLCAFYGVDPDAPAARWAKPSFFDRLFGR